LKLRLRAAIPPCLFLGITCYFAWNAVHGARGLQAQAAERQELARATQQLAAVELTRIEWETKTADLGGQSIAGDMLDAELRDVLNLADPADIVVKLPPNPGK
jgi:cell division protein FtsB